MLPSPSPHDRRMEEILQQEANLRQVSVADLILSDPDIVEWAARIAIHEPKQKEPSRTLPDLDDPAWERMGKFLMGE